MDPYDPNKMIPLLAHPLTLGKIFQAGWSWKAGEYWGLVHGNPPPAHAEAHSAPGAPALRQPRAIFKGLQRPLHNGHITAGNDIYIYVSNPEHTYTYKDHITYGGLLETNRPPVSSVFTTFVSFDSELIDGVSSAVQETPARPFGGIVLFWEWTEASTQEADLPHDFGSRYSKRIYPS